MLNQTDHLGNILLDQNGNILTKQITVGAGDGVIDSKDTIFNQLKVWQDLNQDGISQAGELKHLADYDISSINVGATTATNQNVDGNVIISTSSYQTTTVNEDGSISESTHSYANLDLAIDQTNSSFYSYQDKFGNVVDYAFNLESVTLPLSRGYGNTKAWHIAVSEDAVLLSMMKNMVNLSNVNLETVY